MAPIYRQNAAINYSRNLYTLSAEAFSVAGMHIIQGCKHV